MSSKETVKTAKQVDWKESPSILAEYIRRLNSAQLASLVTALCEDNMGSKLETALHYENLDKTFHSGV
jgi:hypothetical protein